jgi:hypothetical protein
MATGTPRQIVEGFSLSHAAILNGTTGAEDADIYGIRSGSLDADTDQFDNTGDDRVLSTWQWFNFATVTVQAGYVPFEVIALLAGSTISSQGAVGSNTDQYHLPLWNEAALNQARRPMLIRVPSKDATGLARSLTIVLYNVQFGPISFDGPSYKDGLVLNYTGRALLSTKNEKGVDNPNGPGGTPEAMVGRLISAP